MRFNFARKARRMARRQYRRGKITRQEYDHVCEASRDPEVVAKWEAENPVDNSPFANFGTEPRKRGRV